MSVCTDPRRSKNEDPRFPPIIPHWWASTVHGICAADSYGALYGSELSAGLFHQCNAQLI